MRRWEDDLKQRLTGKPALPKYWEYPELEKGNIHQQHCSNCFDLNCESANIDKNKHQSLVLNCSMTNCKFECGARYHACKVSEHKIICPFGELAEEEYSRMFQGVSGEQRRSSGANSGQTSYWSDKYFSDSFARMQEKRKSDVIGEKSVHRIHHKTIGDWLEGPTETSNDNMRVNHGGNLTVPIPPPILQHLNRKMQSQDLRMNLSFTCEPKHAQKPTHQYSFYCSQTYRRDEIGWHTKNVHGDIFGGLNSDLMEHRCPLASYGCGFSVRRLYPKTNTIINRGTGNNNYQIINNLQGSSALSETVIYNPVVEGFGIINTSMGPEEHRGAKNGTRKGEATLLNLPCEVLYSIFANLDSFR